MIRHCVFIRFKADVSAAERASILADIAALQPLVPGYLSVEIGPNVSPEGLGKGYTDGFIIDFKDAAARDAYLVHPAHEKAGGRIVAATEGGVDGVFVYDFEIAG
ncbi:MULTISPECIES: Dabb family protein [unclassified Rhizobium]|uniref:Dabb family protein n=1 Tax=unclassified Rhizobium TaxID=2613769 RepID=UPI0007156691|nr:MULTISPECIES: Dabb family protein [unclassified Rhizobium]KQS88634.1 stress responsive protein [Rhizobium sp. Leaf391]KQT05577.1 stress responsive protein [Rhizobium sp. Leaf386]KQT91302.1 stress responsive protein [Rhizobium sp. Leaf453]